MLFGKGITKNGLDILRKEGLIRTAFIANMMSALFLALAILLLAGIAVYWVLIEFLEINTPAKLAMLSAVVGIFPLAVSGAASLTARLFKISLNESAYQSRRFLGIDIGRLLYQLYLLAWGTLFTAGVGCIGLVAALILFLCT